MRMWVVGVAAAVVLLVPATKKGGFFGGSNPIEVKARRDEGVLVPAGDPAMRAA